MSFKIKTNFPVALDSLDHLNPVGTTGNNTSIPLIEEIEQYFENEKINMCDLGCAGGQFVVDFHNRGHSAIGLEGSDYSIHNNVDNWLQYHNNILFTCDIEHLFSVQDENNTNIKFKCISAWEVLEHIKPYRLNTVLKNIYDLLDDDGIFIGSISLIPCVIQNGVDLHQSRYTQDKWINELFPRIGLQCFEYPFKNLVNRTYVDMGYSFSICAKKINTGS